MQIMRTIKIACNDFETKNLGEYHDLFVQSDILLLADVFENLRNMWSCKICFSLWIRIASSVKKDQSTIRSFNWYRYATNAKKGN